jgi:CBS domain-containing protein
MSTNESTPRSAQELRNVLRTAGDRARLQAHLFSLEAKQRWQEIEPRLRELESKLAQGGDGAVATVSSSLRDAARTVADLLHELDGTLELRTPVQKLMTTDVTACTPDDSLNRAAQVMWERDCGVVPVVDADGKLVGVVTDRDLCMACYTRGLPLSALRVGDAMATEPCVCEANDSIGHAVRLMAERQVRRLPVVEGGRLVGIVALADLARDVRRATGNRLPACVALTHALASISEQRAPASAGASQAAE